MLKAYDVMTRAVATATPQTPVSQVATMMRDMNIGDVLVVEDGKLRGIVTDRDLTINVLTNGANASAPVEKYMSTDIVTGAPDWSLEQVANVMGEHQVRRLPIVENDNVVGIVSLGDVAVHTTKPAPVASSLKNISESTRTRFNAASPIAKVAWVAVPVALTAAILVFANTSQGKRVRKQLSESDLADQARNAIYDAVHTLQDPRTRQTALEALEATGLPERARNVLNEGARQLQNSQARANQLTQDVSQESNRASEYAMYLAEQARQQAQKLPKQVTNRLQKAKPKRFYFV